MSKIADLKHAAGSLPLSIDEYDRNDIRIADEIVQLWMKEHSADEDDPLTEEVLPRFGFTKALNGPTRWYSDWLTLKPAKDGAWAAWGALYNCDKHNCLVVLLTVGDLRRLAVALGYDPVAI